ncbi:hypothetical protein [Paludibacterium purpuratum]|uniref:Uncharacterized protein n=1 Tax=Paludibacterium purpuratum TaxID=1144873 RepID=A0A4R7BE37_9NEIS|nr:hypothetical protein [Paludibacterium purpuratum]TDR81927.1 hypothetical protein DFP86_10237 [Paludibacterium purpuratum]
MTDFAKATFTTAPTPLTLTVAPVIVGSNTVQLQLQPLPTFTIHYAPDGSGWQQFNAGLLEHVANIVIGAVTPFITNTIQTKAQDELNANASFTVPPIPVSFEGISLTLTPTNLNLSTSDADHVLITANVAIN